MVKSSTEQDPSSNLGGFKDYESAPSLPILDTCSITVVSRIERFTIPSTSSPWRTHLLLKTFPFNALSFQTVASLGIFFVRQQGLDSRVFLPGVRGKGLGSGLGALRWMIEIQVSGQLVEDTAIWPWANCAKSLQLRLPVSEISRICLAVFQGLGHQYCWHLRVFFHFSAEFLT